MEELNNVFHTVLSLQEEIETGNISLGDIEDAGGTIVLDKGDAIDAVNFVGRLLELYGA